MKIQGVELEFNIAEEKSNQRVLKAIRSVSEDAEKAQGKEPHEQIRMICESVKNAFDYIWGVGTAEAVCGKENDITRCCDAWTDFLEEKNRQDKKMQESVARLLNVMGGQKHLLGEQNELSDR